MIRKASPEDYEEVERIMRQIQELHVELRPDIYQPLYPMLSKEEYLKMIQEDFLVEEQAGEVCGVLIFMEHTYRNPKQVERKVLFVDVIAVDQRYRGKGIGSDMIAYLKQEAKNRQCDGVELQVNGRNVAAKRMYEKCGFTEKSMNMECTEL